MRKAGLNLYHIAVDPQLTLEDNTRDFMALREDNVHVWEIALHDPTLKTKGMFGEVLSEDEKTRASRLLPGAYRDKFVTARSYMRIILGRYLDTPPGEIRFEYNRYGKPAITSELNKKNISFNLSHSGSLALCAVTLNTAIGIDVEYPRPVLRAEKILERFFSEGEREYYRTRPETVKERAFMNLWTLREAYSKALGRGLSSDLRDIDLSPVLAGEADSSAPLRLGNRTQETWTIHRFSPGDEYIAAVALKGNASVIRHYADCPGLL